VLTQDGRQVQNIANMRGIPLVATSPVRHESPVQRSLEVQTYHPPWKALADYASMQPDCDPNNQYFQHLVSQVSCFQIFRFDNQLKQVLFIIDQHFCFAAHFMNVF